MGYSKQKEEKVQTVAILMEQPTDVVRGLKLDRSQRKYLIDSFAMSSHPCKNCLYDSIR